MNKQEAIEKIKSTLIHENTRHLGKVVNVYGVIDIIKQIDEPKKVKLPKYVDTWYQGAKYNGYDLYEAMTAFEIPDKVDTWIQWNSETFARAWLYGYEVEKEKLYTVELPNPNGDSNRYGLCKVDGRIIIGSFVFGLNKAINTKLTEAEINKDFAWAWQFAEEVKE